MTTREQMFEWRKKKGLSLTKTAEKLSISASLLDMVENGHVTHPNIVRRMQELYGFSDEEAEELLPEIHRKSSAKYEPDKYVAPEPIAMEPPTAKKNEVYFEYVREKRGKGAL